MSKSVWDCIVEAKTKYKTNKNTYNQFTVGTNVKIITPAQDFLFFNGQTGRVIENRKRYLGIDVEFDEPMRFEDGTVLKVFNFEPSDLIEYTPTFNNYQI